MKYRLAVVMSTDGECFIQGNNFDSPESSMAQCERDLDLTGRVVDKKFYLDIEIPKELIPVVTGLAIAIKEVPT